MFYNTIPIYLLEKPVLGEVAVQASILELLSSLVSDIKVAIVAGRDVSNVVQEVAFSFFPPFLFPSSFDTRNSLSPS